MINQEKRKIKVKYDMKHDSFCMKQEARKTFNIKFWAFRSLNYSFLVLYSHEERTNTNFDRLCDKVCNDNFELRIIEEETRTLHERKIRNKNVECRMLLFELDSAPYIYPYYHFPKFQENSSRGYWATSINGRTDGRTDWPTDGQTGPLIEMRNCI